jgi:predicted O-methyltransferase YrrM
VADNILWKGMVADTSDDNPHAVEHRATKAPYPREEDLTALVEFNLMMAASERIECWLCPLWDGLMVGRLVD